MYGTFLSFLARFSWLKPVIDTDKCISCRKCERNCKASCIDIANHKIDYSRCVTCMDCIGNCPHRPQGFPYGLPDGSYSRDGQGSGEESRRRSGRDRG